MSFVKYVSVDGQDKSTSLDVVRRAIGQLMSGDVRSLSMGLDETGDVFFIASRCDPAGIYVSVRAHGEDDEFDLIDVSKPSELIESKVGARTQVITLDAVVPQSHAGEAAEHFFLTGQRLPSAKWRKSEERYQRIAQGEPVRQM